MAFSNFIPEIWSARLLEHMDKVHVYANLMNRDYEGDIKAYGDTVHINLLGDITISNYTGSAWALLRSWTAPSRPWRSIRQNTLTLSSRTLTTPSPTPSWWTPLWSAPATT